MRSVANLLAGYRSGSLDPADVAREAGADPGAATEARRRWEAGSARALEGVPVVATDDPARDFAETHGAFLTDARHAALQLGGGGEALARAARGGGAAISTSGWPTMAASHPAELAAVLEALGRRAGATAAKVGRIEGLGSGETRQALNLAASLAGGLGLDVQSFGARELRTGDPAALRAVAADAEALLLPLDPALVANAAEAGLAALAIPGAWGSGGSHLGLLLAGRDPAALTALATRLHGAMGGGGAALSEEEA